MMSDQEQGDGGQRLLRFPEDQPIGRLWTLPGQTTSQSSHGEDLGLAQGTILRPPKERLALFVRRDLQDLSVLAALQPDDLYKLDLTGCVGVNDSSIADVARLSKLHELALRECAIGDTGLSTVLQALLELEQLDLGWTHASDPTLFHLREHTGLLTLRLDGMKISNGGMPYLSGLVQLHWMDLSFTDIGDAGLSSLTDLSNMQILTLDRTAVTDEGFAIARQMPALREVSITDTRITDAGLEYLHGAIGLVLLKAGLSKVGEQDLAALRHLTNLQTLALFQTPVRDEGLRTLSQLVELRRLSLSKTNITDAGLPHLYRLSKLERLEIKETKISSRGLGDLKRALPQCRISF